MTFIAKRVSGEPSRFEPDFEKTETKIVADTLVVTGAARPDFPHNFVGVQFFSDAEGLIPAIPSAGTVTIAIETVNNKGVFEAPPVSVIDATSPVTVSWAANTLVVRATPSGITGAGFYKMVWTGNRS